MRSVSNTKQASTISRPVLRKTLYKTQLTLLWHRNPLQKDNLFSLPRGKILLCGQEPCICQSIYESYWTCCEKDTNGQLISTEWNTGLLLKNQLENENTKCTIKKKKQYYMTILFLTSWWSTNYMQIISIFQTTTKNFNWNQTQWKTPTAEVKSVWMVYDACLAMKAACSLCI